MVEKLPSGANNCPVCQGPLKQAAISIDMSGPVETVRCEACGEVYERPLFEDEAIQENVRVGSMGLSCARDIGTHGGGILWPHIEDIRKELERRGAILAPPTPKSK